MNEEQRVHALIELYKQQMERFHQTQQVEWKANFGIWTLLASASYLAAQGKFRIASSCPYELSVVATLLLTIVIHGIWLRKIHESEGYDKRLWVEYRTEALEQLRDSRKVYQHEKEWGRSGGAEAIWLVLEVGITCLLSAAFFLLATRN